MRFDLIIVGGGLVGAGLAAALRHTGLQIALIDARLPSSEDPRLFGLNSTTCQFLKNLGVWPALDQYAEPIHQVHVSHQGRFGAVRLNREDVQLPALGYVIPARHIEAELNQVLVDSGIHLFRPATLKLLTQQENLATLTIESPEGEQTLQASIVIGADGTESTVRSLLDIETETFNYEQSAIVTRVILQRSHRHVAYERFNASGAIAMLPLKDEECASIWTADQQTISNLMAQTDEAYVNTLQAAFGYRLGKLVAVHKRHVFPLRMVKAKKSVDQCVFLLGNSAHTLHPIAAQGFNLALYEVAALVEGITAKLAQHESFTAADLDRISQETQRQQKISMTVSHQLAQLFSRDSLAISIAAQLGMVGLDLATPLKRKFIERMLGKTGSVPALLSGSHYHDETL